MLGSPDVVRRNGVRSAMFVSMSFTSLDLSYRGVRMKTAPTDPLSVRQFVCAAHYTYDTAMPRAVVFWPPSATNVGLTLRAGDLL